MLGEIVMGGSASLLICMFLGPRFIDYLRLKEFGQQIREEGPAGHHGKAGTPTMGGLVIFIAIAVPFLILSDYRMGSLAVLATALAMAALGFADDITKLRRRRSLGVSGRTKLLVQAITAVGLWLFVTETSVGLNGELDLRVIDSSVDLGLAYPILIFLVLAGATNGVNLTDGLDGLAAGCAAIVLLTYTVMTFITKGQADLSLLSACLVGACVGFLWFNSFPASVFMGDTGLARVGRRDRRAGRGHEDRGPADRDRRDLRHRGAVGGDPGVRLPALPQARVPDGPDPPPLRAGRLVGDQDHPALLDHRRDLRGHRVHALPGFDPAVVRPPLPEGPYLVVGLARSGTAAVRMLRPHGEVVAVDSGTPEVPADIDAHLGVDGVELLDGVGCVVKSPGVPNEAPVIVAARERGVPVLGELELAWRLLPNRFVAVTGTNGKTTTTELLGAIWREAGLPVAVAGNVGTPLSSLVGELEPDATIVCEVSSFQAEDSEALAPDTALLLNIEEDHLDRHGTFEAYRDAKLRLFRNQTAGAGGGRAAGDGGAGRRAGAWSSGSCRFRPRRSGSAASTTWRTRWVPRRRRSSRASRRRRWRARSGRSPACRTGSRRSAP